MTATTHRVNRQAHAATRLVLALGALLVLVPLLLIFGPALEGRYLPIVRGVQVELVSEDGDRMVFHAVGEKVRACSLTDVKVLVADKPGDVPSKGVIYPIDDGVGPRQRPLGLQDLGVWSIQPVGGHLQIQGTYRCHPLWETVVRVGEWRRP
jgi:hypothetical protein